MSILSVPDVSPRVVHVASGDAAQRTSFAFGFLLADITDLAVFQDGSALEGGFTTALDPAGPGGTITLAAPAPEGAEIVILRATPLERATDFVENGAFRATALNQELNRLTMMAQELSLALKGGLHRPASEAGAMLVLPGAAARAGGLLGFSADGIQVAILPQNDLRGEKGETGPQGLPGDMHGSMNLAELTDPVAARANLSVPSQVETDAALADFDAALDGLEMNLALNTLRDVIASGWSLLDMIDGFADAFTDESGVALPVYLANYVPVMTSNSAPSGTASASSEYSSFGFAWKAFNGTNVNADDCWCANASAPGWVQYALPAGQTKVARKITLTNRNSSVPLAPTNFTFAGSNDGVNWTTLLTVTGNTATGQAQSHSYAFPNATAYNAYRLTITAHTGGGVPNNPALARLELFEADGALISSTGQAYDAAGDFYRNEMTGDDLIIIHADGANNATIFTDASRFGRAITRTGSPVVSTAQSRFGGASAFLGTASDAWTLNIPNDTALHPGGGDFTVDCWIYPTSMSGAYLGILHHISGGNAGWSVSLNNTQARVLVNGNTQWSLNTTAFTANEWQHFAVVKQGTNVMFFRNGVLLGTVSGASAVVSPPTGDFVIGDARTYSSSWLGTCMPFYGYMDEFRYVRSAVWTANFTPPTTPYAPTPVAMTLVSNAWAADATPVAGRAVLLVDPIDAVTLNTDLIVEISRDDGATWNAGALVVAAQESPTIQVLATEEVDLSAQPVGQAMRVRLRAPTGKAVWVHAWALQWR